MKLLDIENISGINMKKSFALSFTFSFVLVFVFIACQSAPDKAVLAKAVDVSIERIELPYSSTAWIKKRLKNGNTYSTDFSDPNLQFVTDVVEDNFQYFEIKCRICSPMQEIMLILRENSTPGVFEADEPEVRAYNVYVV